MKRTPIRFDVTLRRVYWGTSPSEGQSRWTAEIEGIGEPPIAGAAILEQDPRGDELIKLRGRIWDLEKRLEAARKALESK